MISLIHERLASYKPINQIDEENAIKEILQEIALYGLWRSDFFKIAAFQGGTCLRILHGMNRFSEDLDFILKEPAKNFSWSDYIQGLRVCFAEFGLNSEILSKGDMDQRIRKAVVKDNSLCKQLNLSFLENDRGKKQKIKIEIDINPPVGSGFEYSYLDFPLDFEICGQDLPSNFALKIHAILCRPYVKGRDWYDFNWYVKKCIKPNLPLLQQALYQWGPWQQENITLNSSSLKDMLDQKICDIDWRAAAADVERFLKPPEQHGLRLWGEKFFKHKVDQLQ